MSKTRGSLIVLTIFVTVGQWSLSSAQPYREYFKSSKYPVQTFKELKQVFLDSNDNPVARMTTPQVLKYYGYPVESHRVVTKDGYILTMHRIPHGLDSRTTAKKSRPPVFLQHGYLGSSFEWLMNTKDRLLPLQLADAGYDVWLGNARGTTYSRGHLNMSVRSPNYWKFSVNEMGKYDIPAEIDYLLANTGQSQLFYIGFSMGTTMFFTMMSHHPEYNGKVRLMTALAPIVYLNHSYGLLYFFTIFERIPLLKSLLETLSGGELIPFWINNLLNIFAPVLCSNTLSAESFCGNFNFLYAGWDTPQLLINQIPVLFGHAPTPTSVRTTMHLLQFIQTGVFREYDFGRPGNMAAYGRDSPPLYSLKNTTAPVALLYGPNDGVVTPIDVARVAAELPNVVLHSPIDFKFWNHLDYHLGRDANSLVNERVIQLLAKY